MHFLGSHSITVIDPQGHHWYQIEQPKCIFNNGRTRKRFQSLIRGRDLLGEFEAKDLYCGRRLLAKAQVIQLWSEHPLLTVSMTFLATPFNEPSSLVEWDIGRFQPHPARKGRRLRKPRELILQPRDPRAVTESASIIFEDARGI
jgi:hypothetical protein